MIIGITGKAQNGKDTIGDILHDRYGFEKHAFAASLKAAAYALNPLVFIPDRLRLTILNPFLIEGSGRMYVNSDGSEFSGTDDEAGVICNFKTVVDVLGWEKAKTIDGVRICLQRFGTEVGREIFGENFWVDMAMKPVYKNAEASHVFTDVRFNNEAQAIREVFGIVIEVVRPNSVSVPVHVSENGISQSLINHQVINDGTISDLEEKILRIIKEETE